VALVLGVPCRVNLMSFGEWHSTAVEMAGLKAKSSAPGSETKPRNRPHPIPAVLGISVAHSPLVSSSAMSRISTPLMLRPQMRIFMICDYQGLPEYRPAVVQTGKALS
jgi:hypothetical protein